MIFYITVLRAVAAILITNAHYIGVYPTDLIANGGLLGDVIFFAVSGFCLVNVKQTFPIWYGRRVIRIYPVVWIITFVYIILGFYAFEQWNIIQYLLYPTYYHFVASIIVLYVPFYFVVTRKMLFNNIPKIMIALFIFQILLYVFLYDKSIYHIDTVREPMIRFLFFESMLLGAYFKVNGNIFMNKNKIGNWVVLSVLFIGYFASKFIFLKFEELNPYQIINQIILFALLYFMFRCFASIDIKLEGLPNKIKYCIRFISKITLEIYVVQYVIIERLAFIIFPINWIVITITIIATAFILKFISLIMISSIELAIKKSFKLKISGGHNL